MKIQICNFVKVCEKNLNNLTHEYINYNNLLFNASGEIYYSDFTYFTQLLT